MSGAGNGVNQPPSQATASQGETTAEDASGEGSLVLIVEDERPIADAIRLVVEEAGYTAILAYTGLQGLELARTLHPALITTDYMMPGLNGSELIAALRQAAITEVLPVPPIIMISAVTSPQVYRSGYDRFLAKPFEIDELITLLHFFLRRTDPIAQPLTRQ